MNSFFNFSRFKFIIFVSGRGCLLNLFSILEILYFLFLIWLKVSKDGIDVTEHGATNGSPVPIEVSESKLPILFKKSLLWTDSGGAGKWRGGLGYTAEVQWMGGECYGSFRRDRMKFKPWGVEGGHSAPLCKTTIISKKKKVSLPGKIDHPLFKGDTIEIHTTGSGGFGDPAKR